MRTNGADADDDHVGVDDLPAQVRRRLGPLVWTATGLEALAAGSAIAARVPAPIASALLVGIPLGSFALDRHRRLQSLERRFRELYTFDRRYERVLSRWTFRESGDPEYWDATHHGEREMTVLAPMASWRWSIQRRSDDDVPAGAPSPVLRNHFATRSGPGDCTFLQPHKQKSTLAFRIEFEPRLRPGETVSISFDLDVFQHKPATLEALRRRPVPAIAPPGESEFSSYDVTFPTARLTKEIVIPERLGAGRFDFQALLRDNDFTVEAQHIREHALFDATQVKVDGQPAWRLRLERVAPPLRATYRLCWRLPARDRVRGPSE